MTLEVTLSKIFQRECKNTVSTEIFEIPYKEMSNQSTVLFFPVHCNKWLKKKNSFLFVIKIVKDMLF